MNFREGQQVILQIETKRNGLRARFESVGIVNSRFAYVAGMRFRAVELDPQRAARLAKTCLKDRVAVAAEVDFLTLKIARQYDAILMNPPFATERDRLEYIRHITLSYALLDAGGRLVSIAPSGLKHNTDKRTDALRELIAVEGGSIEDLPRDTFKASGTLVGTVLVYIQKSRL